MQRVAVGEAGPPGAEFIADAEAAARLLWTLAKVYCSADGDDGDEGDGEGGGGGGGGGRYGAFTRDASAWRKVRWARDDAERVVDIASRAAAIVAGAWTATRRGNNSGAIADTWTRGRAENNNSGDGGSVNVGEAVAVHVSLGLCFGEFRPDIAESGWVADFDDAGGGGGGGGSSGGGGGGGGGDAGGGGVDRPLAQSVGGHQSASSDLMDVVVQGAWIELAPAR